MEINNFMTFNELKEKAKSYPLFKLEDIFKWFPAAKKQTTLNQINFWIKRGWLERVKNGVYRIKDFGPEDPFIIANFIYSPSYISLESALNYYSIIPDIPFGTTSVTIKKTKIFKIKSYGVFYYNHLKSDLFFGYKNVIVEKNYSYNIAFPEKALFDYIYLKAKGITSYEGFIEELRLSLTEDFNWKNLLKWQKLVPSKNKTFHELINILCQRYYGE